MKKCLFHLLLICALRHCYKYSPYFIHYAPRYANYVSQKLLRWKVKSKINLSMSQTRFFIFKVERCLTVWKFQTWTVDKETWCGDIILIHIFIYFIYIFYIFILIYIFNFKWSKLYISYCYMILTTVWKSYKYY